MNYLTATFTLHGKNGQVPRPGLVEAKLFVHKL